MQAFLDSNILVPRQNRDYQNEDPKWGAPFQLGTFSFVACRIRTVKTGAKIQCTMALLQMATMVEELLGGEV